MTAECTVLLTGGAGYIGSHACKGPAEAGFRPVTCDNLSIGKRWPVRWGRLKLGDMADAARLHEAFRRYKPVGVLHFVALALVGESAAEPGLYYRADVGGALSVLDAARTRPAPSSSPPAARSTAPPPPCRSASTPRPIQSTPTAPPS